MRVKYSIKGFMKQNKNGNRILVDGKIFLKQEVDFFLTKYFILYNSDRYKNNLLWR